MFRRYSVVLAMAMFVIAGAYGSAGAQTEAEIREAHGRLMDAMNAHDIDLWLSYCTDDFVFDYVAVPSTWNKEQTKPEFESGLFQGFPDFQATPQRVLVSGNILVDEKTFTGTHQGEWQGIPASGNSIQMWALDIFEFEGDRLKKVTVYVDVVSWLAQVGAMPVGELPPLDPSFTLPDPEPTGLAPLDVAREVVEVWNTHDLTPWAKMFQLDGDFFYNVLGIPMSRDQLVALQELLLLAFSDVQGEFVRMVDLGDGWVMAETVFQGTHDGPYFGIPATGRFFPLRVGFLERFDEDGLATYFHIYFDNLTMMVQMGVVEPPGPSSVSTASWGQIKSLF